jgi:hypothetical protein
MEISSSGATVENAASLTGDPAVSITGDNVTFVNKSGGSIIGHAAIAISGSGATIVNEAGGYIRGTPSGFGYDFLAILGSDFADTLINPATSSTTSAWAAATTATRPSSRPRTTSRATRWPISATGTTLPSSTSAASAISPAST